MDLLNRRIIQIFASNQSHSAILHVLNCCLDTKTDPVYSPAGIFYECDVKTELHSVESSFLDTIVGSQSSHKYVRDAIFLKETFQLRGFATLAVEKAAKAIDIGIHTFFKNTIDLFDIQIVEKLRAFCIFDAMHWKQWLVVVAHTQSIADFLIRMIDGKTDMIGGMPVLSRNHKRKNVHKLVEYGHDFLGSGNGQFTAGAEPLLCIHYDQRRLIQG